MITVALAGATTGFGLTMLRTFLRLNIDNQYKFVLLSRSPQPYWSHQGIDVRSVDYTNHGQLIQALQGVHTLLSTIGGDEGALEGQLALLSAAKEAGVKRWAPSEYAIIGYDGLDLYAPKALVWEATQKSGLEYTRFSCGLFMSVFATGTPKPSTALGKSEGAKTGEEEALAGLRPWNFIINMKNGTVDYALDGSSEVTFTDMRDVAEFVYRALSLPKWEPDMGMRGDLLSFRQAVEIVERIQKRKFLVKNNTMDELRAEAEIPAKRFYNQVRIRIADGAFVVPNNLNKAFPDYRPVTVEHFVEKWWAGVELGSPGWTEDASFM